MASSQVWACSLTRLSSSRPTLEYPWLPNLRTEYTMDATDDEADHPGDTVIEPSDVPVSRPVDRKESGDSYGWLLSDDSHHGTPQYDHPMLDY